MPSFLTKILLVGLGGAIGAILRFLITEIPIEEPFSFPVKTFAINIVGCFVIGVLVGIATNLGQLDKEWLNFAKVGFCGGFTTLSAMAVEVIDIAKSGLCWVALGYVVATVVFSILAAFLGEYLVIAR